MRQRARSWVCTPMITRNLGFHFILLCQISESIAPESSVHAPVATLFCLQLAAVAQIVRIRYTEKAAKARGPAWKVDINPAREQVLDIAWRKAEAPWSMPHQTSKPTVSSFKYSMGESVVDPV